MKRYLEHHIQGDLPQKVVLLTGPRQCGKTTLSKQLYSSYDYFNYDLAEHRLALSEKSWDRQKKLIIFRVTPYSKNIARSLLKEPKFYFYDHTYADDDHGARLENMVACSLIKELHYLEDVTGYDAHLHYLRTKDGREIDFLISIDGKVQSLIEVKSSDSHPSKAFTHFSKFLTDAKKIQLVRQLEREKTFPDGVEVRSLIHWLANLNLLDEVSSLY